MIDLEISDAGMEVQMEVCEHVEVEVGGTSDYEELINKPAIEGNEIWKNTKLEDIGLVEVTNAQIEALFKNKEE